MGRLRNALDVLVYGEKRAAMQFGESIPYSRYIARNAPVVEGNLLALPIVRRCVGEIVNLVLSAVLVIIGTDGSRTKRVPTWLRNPNGIFTLRETISQMVWESVFKGELFLTWNKDARDRPTDIWVPRSEDVSFYGTGTGITYTEWWNADATQTSQYFSHRRTLAAPGVWRGVGVTRTGRMLTDSAQSVQKSIDNHLLSDILSSIVFAFAGKLPDDSRKAFLAMLARNHQGPDRAGAPLVTDRDLKVHRLDPSMADKKLMELMRELDARIAAEVFFLDPAYLAIGTDEYRSLSYQNLGQARAQNWSRAAAHHAATVAEAFTDLLGEEVVFDPTEPLRGSPSDRAQLQRNVTLANADQVKAGLPPLYFPHVIREVIGLSGSGPGPMTSVESL